MVHNLTADDLRLLDWLAVQGDVRLGHCCCIAAPFKRAVLFGFVQIDLPPEGLPKELALVSLTDSGHRAHGCSPLPVR